MVPSGRNGVSRIGERHTTSRPITTKRLDSPLDCRCNATLANSRCEVELPTSMPTVVKATLSWSQMVRAIAARSAAVSTCSWEKSVSCICCGASLRTARIGWHVARLAAAQPDIGPRRRQFADARLYQERPAADRTLEQLFQVGRRLNARIADVEGGGEAVEMRIVQLGAQHGAELLLLHALDVAEMAVVEHHHRGLQAVFGGGRQLLHAPAEAAVAGDAEHGAAGIAVSGAERGRIAVAERALIAGRDVGAGRIDRKRRARLIADLRQLVDENAVVGKASTQRANPAQEIGHVLLQ